MSTSELSTVKYNRTIAFATLGLLIFNCTFSSAYALPYSYRAVHIIINNDSNLTMTMSGYYTERGQWQHSNGMLQPCMGNTIANHNTFSFGAYSNTPSVGTAGMLRFTTTQGDITVQWQQPWVGTPHLTLQLEQSGTINYNIHSNQSTPAFPVYIITINDH